MLVNVNIPAGGTTFWVPFLIDDNLAAQTFFNESYTVNNVENSNAFNSAVDEIFTHFKLEVGVDIPNTISTCVLADTWRDTIHAYPVWENFIAACIRAGYCSSIQTYNFSTAVSATTNGGGTGYLVPDGMGILWAYTSSSYASGNNFLVDSDLPTYDILYAAPQMWVPVLPSIVIQNGVLDLSYLPDSYGQYLKRLYFNMHYDPRSGAKRIVANLMYGVVANTSVTIAKAKTMLGTPTFEPINEDPYTPDVPGGGPSEPGGGEGTWDFSDDDIPLPTLPTISSLDSGFIAAYSPTLAQLNDLASYMWTPNFITNLVKLFGDSPMDVIMGLSIIPITPPTGTAIHVKLGNLDSNVSMKPITQQFVTVDCGSITLPGIYDAFLDWEPFTKATLYLPYIGAVNLNTNDIMGKTVNVTYYIDVISGACNAMVSAGGSVLYTFNGQCAAQMPITGSDYRSMFQSAIQGAVSLITGTMSGIAGNTSGVVAGISGVAGAATNFHPNVVHSGSVAGTAGMLAVQTPYLIVTVPHICAPARQNYYKGYPGLVTVPLGTLSGFTVVESIHLDLMPGTKEEKREMMELLTGGVIL